MSTPSVSERLPAATARRATWALVLLLGLGAWAARAVVGLRVPAPEGAGVSWISTDPDTLYHARRTSRALEQGLVASRDPLLAAGEPGVPAEGAAIPWPPHGTVLNALWCLVQGIGADDPAIETAIASLPAVLGALAAVLLALATAHLARGAPRWGPLAAGLFAGAGLAVNLASLRYSAVGNGDHHTLASLLIWACMLCGVATLDAGRGRDRHKVSRLASWTGVAAALALGTWVGSLPFVALTGIVLTLKLKPLEALRFFGLALLCLLPAVLTSPWLGEAPWSLVMLSCCQPGWLAAGAVTCMLGRLLRGNRRSGTHAHLIPLLAASVILLAGGGAAFEWGMGDGGFMSAVRESRAAAPAQVLRHLGPGALLAVPGLVLLFLRRPPGAWLLVPAGIGFAVLGFIQLRLVELSIGPLLLLGGLSLAPLFGRLPAGGLGGVIALGLAALLGLLGQLPGGADEVLSRFLQASDTRSALLGQADTVRTAHQRAVRSGIQRLGDLTGQEPSFLETPGALDSAGGDSAGGDSAGEGTAGEPSEDESIELESPGAVLAAWDLGHLIEWVAGRPTVATNFGSYVAPEGFLLPWRFFSARGAEAEGLLRQREISHVVATSTFLRHGPAVVRNLGEAAWDAARTSPLLVQAGLLPGEQVTEAPPDFLRPVVLGPPRAVPGVWGGGRGDRLPAVAIWERVEGARLQLFGRPGEVARISLRLEFPAAGRDLLWWGEAEVGLDGLARLRVPCPTEPFGDAVPRGPLEWTVGGRRGEVQLSEEAVRLGLEVRADS